MKTLILSHRIDRATPLYGGRRKIRLLSEKSIRKRDSSNILRLGMNTHTSTHVDMPFHFIQKGPTVSDYKPDSWVFSDLLVKEIRLRPKERMERRHFRDLEYNKTADLLIIKTGFERFRKKKVYTKESPVVSSALGGFFKKRLPNLRAVGFDFISLSSLTDREEGRRAHKEFLKNNILIIEDMKLSDLKSKPDFTLVSPLFIDKADGSPVSVWAFYNDFDIERYDYIFFDFDGVILDSEHIKIEGFGKIYERHGRDVRAKVIEYDTANSGRSRFEKFKLYHKKFLSVDIKDAQVQRLAGEYSRIVLSKVMRAKFIPGALEFLKFCRRRRKTCFLVSATAEDDIKKTVKGRNLTKYFKEVKGSPLGKEENIRRLIKRYNVKRRKAVFFGDSSSDLEAVNRNNISFVGITHFNGAINYRDFKELISRSRR